MAKNAKNTLQSLINIMRGIVAVLTTGKSMAFRKGTIDGPGLAAIVGPILAAFQVVGDQKTVWKASVTNRHAIEPAASQLIEDVQKGVDMSFGSGSVEFEQFGFTPKKPSAALTPEQKQLKLERMRATRVARGTLGKRQKKAVKGVVPTPPTTPPAQGQSGAK